MSTPLKVTMMIPALRESIPSAILKSWATEFRHIKTRTPHTESNSRCGVSVCQKIVSCRLAAVFDEATQQVFFCDSSRKGKTMLLESSGPW